MTRSEPRLRRRLKYQVERMKQAEESRGRPFDQTRFIVTLGLLMALPVVIGGYLGVLLDNLCAGFSTGWTIGLLIVGAVLGCVNAILFVRE